MAFRPPAGFFPSARVQAAVFAPVFLVAVFLAGVFLVAIEDLYFGYPSYRDVVYITYCFRVVSLIGEYGSHYGNIVFLTVGPVSA